MVVRNFLGLGQRQCFPESGNPVTRPCCLPIHLCLAKVFLISCLCQPNNFSVFLNPRGVLLTLSIDPKVVDTWACLAGTVWVVWWPETVWATRWAGPEKTVVVFHIPLWRHVYHDVIYTMTSLTTIASHTTMTSLWRHVPPGRHYQVRSGLGRIEVWSRLGQESIFDSLTTVKPLTRWLRSNLWPVDCGQTFDPLTAVKPLTCWSRSNLWPVHRSQTFDSLTAVKLLTRWPRSNHWPVDRGHRSNYVPDQIRQPASI